MNWLDLALALVILWFAIAGATAGFVRESVTLLAALLGVVVAGLTYRALAADILEMTSGERTARIIAFSAIFLAVLLAGQIVAMLLKGVTRSLALGWLDHPAGLVVGVIKGVAIVEAVLFLFARYHVNGMLRAMDGSLLTPFFLHGVPVLLALLPADFRSAVHAFPGQP